MVEEIIPDVEMTPDVAESNVNYSEMTLAELYFFAPMRIYLNLLDSPKGTP